MSGLVGNSENRVSRIVAHLLSLDLFDKPPSLMTSSVQTFLMFSSIHSKLLSAMQGITVRYVMLKNSA